MVISRFSLGCLTVVSSPSRSARPIAKDTVDLNVHLSAVSSRSRNVISIVSGRSAARRGRLSASFSVGDDDWPVSFTRARFLTHSFENRLLGAATGREEKGRKRRKVWRSRILRDTGSIGGTDVGGLRQRRARLFLWQMCTRGRGGEGANAVARVQRAGISNNKRDLAGRQRIIAPKSERASFQSYRVHLFSRRPREERAIGGAGSKRCNRERSARGGLERRYIILLPSRGKVSRFCEKRFCEKRSRASGLIARGRPVVSRSPDPCRYSRAPPLSTPLEGKWALFPQRKGVHRRPACRAATRADVPRDVEEAAAAVTTISTNTGSVLRR